MSGIKTAGGIVVGTITVIGIVSIAYLGGAASMAMYTFDHFDEIAERVKRLQEAKQEAK